MVFRSEIRALVAGALCLTASCSDDDSENTGKDSGSATVEDAGADAGENDASDASDEPSLGFFVTSDKSATGNLGGLPGADARCEALAEAVGAGSRTWRAYLSVEKDPANGGNPTHARDRIGAGPWYNAKGVLLAADVDALHALTGDAELFLDEKGEKINGQWEGSPSPNEHDVLTGSDAQGRVAPGKTCADWTSADATLFAQVGHSDGLGPMRNGAPPFNSWQSSHESGGCNNTTPRGGAGRLYCFAAD
jgi:hypothetical protein